MKTSTSTLLAAAMLLGVSAPIASAQTTAPDRKAFGTGELPEFLKPYDLNEDGKLSIEERQAYEKATREARQLRPGRVNPWDTNGDGVLSEEEKAAARAAIAERIKAERTKRFNELDTDKDGYLTAEELAKIPHITPEQIAAMIARLDTADENGVKDGKISLDEFLAALRPVEPPFPPFPLPQPLPKFKVPCPLILKAFDTSGDGMLDPTELAAMLTALDTNTDGRITLEEWKAYLEAHPELLPRREGDGSGGAGPGPGPGPQP
jgi:Ca2+-binding EF-hand superfamily protein